MSRQSLGHFKREKKPTQGPSLVQSFFDGGGYSKFLKNSMNIEKQLLYGDSEAEPTPIDNDLDQDSKMSAVVPIIHPSLRDRTRLKSFKD